MTGKKKPSAPVEAEALSVKAVAAMLSISPRSVYNLINAPGFPVSIRIGRSRRWLRAEVMDWLVNRADRDAPPARLRDGR